MDITPSGPHPRIPPWLRPIRRRPDEVQFGVLPDGPIVTGVSDAEYRLLEVLDGARSVHATYRMAAAAGVAPRRWAELLHLLGRLGVLDVPPAEAPVGLSGVLVDGVGPLVDDIAVLLRRSGIQPVVHGGPAVDAVVADPTAARPALVVIVGTAALDPHRGDLWLHHGVPHLPVVPAGPRTTVGPLVLAGTPGPCLWCLHLHRADRDEAWPLLVAQLSQHGAAVLPGSDGAGLAPALSQLVAGSVALYAQRLLAGERPPDGVSVEVSLPWPRMDHRRWSVHPRCVRHPAASVDDVA